ncbi:MAG: ABC transporter substrate-binding protein [Chloroflexota bacterium]
MLIRCGNANDGIGNRPVQYIVEDDAWDPEKTAQASAKLVNDDKVVALVGGTGFVECATNAKLYADNNVLDIAGWVFRESALNQKYRTDKWGRD